MKLGFLGVGRIASAVVKGLCTSKIENLTVHLSPRNVTTSASLDETFSNVTRLSSNQMVLDRSDVVFLSLPNDIAKDILENLRFRKDHSIISVMPYLFLSDLEKAVKPAARICRAVPLPTVIHHTCPIPLFHGDNNVIDLFRHIGRPVIVSRENHLHILWTLTGFIAPFFDLLETFSTWSTEHGVAESLSNRYIMDMFHSLTYSAGAEEQIDFQALVEHATTPKGMNEQAVKRIRAKKVHEAYSSAADHLLKRFPADV